MRTAPYNKFMPFPKSTHRRGFLKRTSIVASALSFPFVSSNNILGANHRLHVAAIGAGGKGGVDIGYCDQENVVALCDADTRQAAGSQKKFPKARLYQDFRVMLEKEQHRIDAVTISTPDHTHAHPAVMAMRLGKHVYCQKPLTHTVEEARLLTRVARETGVVTQMGNQGHAQSDSRRLVECLRGGILGEVKQVHVWTDRPIWPQGLRRPSETQSIPSTLDWDLWIGPAPCAPTTAPMLHSTGAVGGILERELGDMGCHNMDLAFRPRFEEPTRIEGSGEGGTDQSPPKASAVKWSFPGNEHRGPVALTWYDGGRKPSPELVSQKELPGNGCIIMGTRDTLYVPSYWGAEAVSRVRAWRLEPHSAAFPDGRGGDQDNDMAHHHEWLATCKGEAKALSHFDYAGPMTEAVLLGNVALRAGHAIDWDAHGMRVTNDPHANQWIRKAYRKGWELPM